MWRMDRDIWKQTDENIYDFIMKLCNVDVMK